MTAIEASPECGIIKPLHQPKPIFPSVSYLVRWSVRELKAWLAAGCPRIEEWSRIQGRRDDPLRDQRYRRDW